MKVEDFEDLVLTSQNVRGKLEDLGCFSKVGIHIDTSNTGHKDYTVTYQVIVEVLNTWKMTLHEMTRLRRAKELLGQ